MTETVTSQEYATSVVFHITCQREFDIAHLNRKGSTPTSLLWRKWLTFDVAETDLACDRYGYCDRTGCGRS